MKDVNIISKVVNRKSKEGVITPSAVRSSVSMEGYLKEKVWDSVFEVKTDTNGVPYIFVKAALVTQYGITLYRDNGLLDLPSIYDGLPIDGVTIYWENGILKAKGGGAMPDLTNYATIDYVNDRLNAIVSGAPDAFDTLNEIAEVLQGNVNSIGDILSVLGTKFDKDNFTKSNIKSTLGISDWALAESKPSYTYTEIGGTPTSLKNPTSLTFGSKTYDGSEAKTIVASDLGALTSHQTIYALTLQAGTFSAGTYTPNSAAKTINIPTTTAHISESGNLYFTNARAVSALSSTLASYVTLGGSQTITGAKNFTGGLSVNGGSLIYNASEGYWKLEGNLLVTGGVSMYNSGDSDIPSGGGGGSINFPLSWSGFSSGSFDGSAAKTIYIPSKLSELTNDSGYALSSALSDYLPKSGGTLTGALSFANNTWNRVGDDVAIGDIDVAGFLGLKSLNTARTGIWFYGSSGEDHGALYSDSTTLLWRDYPILHSGNYSSYALPLTGGILKSSNYNVLSIVRATTATDYGISLNFSNSNGEVCNLVAHQTTHYFSRSYNGTNYAIWDSGNDGSGSGLDADLLDGLDSSDFARAKADVWSNEINCLGYSYLGHGWDYYGPSITFGQVAYYGRIQKPYDSNRLFLSGYSQEAGELGVREFAFTDSNVASANYAATARDVMINYTGLDTNYEVVLTNPKDYGGYGMDALYHSHNKTITFNPSTGVLSADTFSGNAASATKLQTARTIWGQSFDGTGNVDGRLTISSGAISGSTWASDSGQLLVYQGNYNSNRYCIGISSNTDGYCEIQSASAGIGAIPLVLQKLGGNVGIGTTNPGEKLHVAGKIYAADGIGTDGGLTVIGKVGFGTLYPAYALDVNGSIHAVGGLYAGTLELYYATPFIDFHFNNSTADYTSRIIEGLSGQLTITGKLRIGLSYTESTDYNFYVAGSAYISSNILTGGSITMNSMRSMKNIINEKGLSLEELSTIKPTRFTWKDGRDDRIHVGGIADDVMKVLPEVVFKGNDGVLSMDYASAAFVMAASLIQPMTEHERRIANLERENALLKEEIRNLKSA